MTTNSKKQILNEYKSSLPDFLINFVDSIIKIDRSQILRYDFLHYKIDQLLRQTVPFQEALCLFYDPEGLNHIFVQNIKQFIEQFPYLSPETYMRDTWTTYSTLPNQEVKYCCHKFYLKHLSQSQLQKLSKLSIVTIDQVRLKCIANIYMNPQQLLTDIFNIISWNQLFRTSSTNSHIYLNTLMLNISQQVNKKKLHKKFHTTKIKDYQRLLTYYLKYKINTQKWPFIPDKFRQYQEIDHYVPTPAGRSEEVNTRIETKKVPVECPDGCVCYAGDGDDRDFCMYTLKDGWVSECPNRVNKIQCNHSDPQKMAKCRNAQIKKSQTKKCRKNNPIPTTATSSPTQNADNNSDYDIQQCIIWGIDFYTHNNIFYSLPQADIINCYQYQENKDYKNDFIQNSLLKAINFGGVKGWDLAEACKLIIQYDQDKDEGYIEGKGEKEKNDMKDQRSNQKQQDNMNKEEVQINVNEHIIDLRNICSNATHANSNSSTITVQELKAIRKQRQQGPQQPEQQSQKEKKQEQQPPEQQLKQVNQQLKQLHPDQPQHHEQDPTTFRWNQSRLQQFLTQYTTPSPTSSTNQPLFTKKDKFYTQILLKNYQFCQSHVSKQAYRIHTKGKGARCIQPQGIKHGQLIIQYYGQLYQPWRWYQRQDFIKQIMKKRKLKNYIPQFYNIYLQHHKDDPQGYDIMVVDPNKKGNYSSRFSHSCNPNCGTIITISNGKYYIGMYSFKDIKYGEELTFDYCCMTESNYQHVHSICLCGTQKCRGNYLELANSRTFSQLVQKNTCFLSRNSLILQALQPLTPQDITLCTQHNIKQRMLSSSPEWIKKWTSKLLKFIISQTKLYKQQLIQKWTKQFPWQEPTNLQQRNNLIQLYAQTSKNDLFVLRFQNLFTTVNKMKYFLNTIGAEEPPLYFLGETEIEMYMVRHQESIFREIQEILIQNQRDNQAYLMKYFRGLMGIPNITTTRTQKSSIEPSQPPHPQQIKKNLFFFRLCCLCISHMCLYIEPSRKFNSHLFADIIYFYAFTHTYFTANQYKSHISQEIKVSLMEITGKPSDSKICQKTSRRYSSQFVWGQLASWYKQTIVNPQASLSQDRRGTLSYPMIKSTITSRYPFDKHCRSSFIKALRQKSATSWPCAPQSGCSLSFKNPFKCYGTVFFQNIHNSQKFKDLPNHNLLQNILNSMNSNFHQKLTLFKQIQQKMSGIHQLDEQYNILQHIQSKYFSFTDPIPNNLIEVQPEKKQKRRKKIVEERDQDE